ncbi:unnamed protein product [Lampetra planeri]
MDEQGIDALVIHKLLGLTRELRVVVHAVEDSDLSSLQVARRWGHHRDGLKSPSASIDLGGNGDRNHVPTDQQNGGRAHGLHARAFPPENSSGGGVLFPRLRRSPPDGGEAAV